MESIKKKIGTKETSVKEKERVSSAAKKTIKTFAPAAERPLPRKAEKPVQVKMNIKELTGVKPAFNSILEPPKVEYKDYGIKRTAGTRRRGFFTFAVIAAIVLISVLAANLLFDNAIFGMFNASPANTEQITLGGINFSGIETNQFENKAAALEHSQYVIKQGGAGYVLAEEGQPYRVICCIYCDKAQCETEWKQISSDNLPNARVKEFNYPAKTIAIRNSADREAFETLTKSFAENLTALCSHLIALAENKTTAKEISGWALFTYNNLQKKTLDFGKIQDEAKSSVYAKTLLQVNKQLLALYQLSYAADSTNYLSILKNTACTVAFSYVELISA